MPSPKNHEQLTPFGHALAGALGAVFSNAAIYPLDTAKTRIQASSAKDSVLSTSSKAAARKPSALALILRILRKEGAGALYNGFAANMLNTFSTQYAYFFFYSLVRGAYIKRLTQRAARNGSAASAAVAISTAAELLLGAIAGALAQIFTIPVSVIATRQQLGLSQRSQAETAPSAPRSPSEVSAEKPSYSSVADPREPITPMTYAASKEKAAETTSFLGVAREIIREEGVTGLWLGLKPSLVLTVNPAITYGVFERLKALLIAVRPTSGGRLTPGQAFLIGALSKSLATIVTYPYIMAKVRIQAGTNTGTLPPPASAPSPSSSSTSKSSGEGAVTLLARVLREQGLAGWYTGMSAQITKAVLAQALLFASKDQFEHYAFVILSTMHGLVGK